MTVRKLTKAVETLSRKIDEKTFSIENNMEYKASSYPVNM
jgi:hypothetical protein